MRPCFKIVFTVAFKCKIEAAPTQMILDFDLKIRSYEFQIISLIVNQCEQILGHSSVDINRKLRVLEKYCNDNILNVNCDKL